MKDVAEKHWGILEIGIVNVVQVLHWLIWVICNLKAKVEVLSRQAIAESLLEICCAVAAG